MVWKLVQDRKIQAMAHIESVVSPVLTIVEGILRSLRFIRSARVPDAVSVCPLEPGGKSFAKAAIERRLHRIVVIRAAAGFEIDPRRGKAVAEFCHGGSRTRGWIHRHPDELVGPGSQEQIAALAPYIRDGQDRVAGKRLLPRSRVGQNSFG